MPAKKGSKKKGSKNETVADRRKRLLTATEFSIVGKKRTGKKVVVKSPVVYKHKVIKKDGKAGDIRYRLGGKGASGKKVSRMLNSEDGKFLLSRKIATKAGKTYDYKNRKPKRKTAAPRKPRRKSCTQIGFDATSRCVDRRRGKKLTQEQLYEKIGSKMFDIDFSDIRI